MTPGPLVSIGIPTYNRAALLPRSLRSALDQSHSHIEVIVSDNASSDGTEAACRGFVAADRRVRYIRQEQNVGPTRNFNAVLEAARGEYFMWLADDDWLDADYVARCLVVLGDPEFVAAAGRAKLYAASGGFKEYDAAISLRHPAPAARVLSYYARVTFNSLFYGLARREIVRKVGLDNALASDWKTVGTLALYGKLATVEETSLHRMAAGTSQSFANTLRTLRLPLYQGYFPRILIAFGCARSAFSSDVIADLPWGPRAQLALKVFAILMLRFSWMRQFIPRQLRNRFVASYY